MKTVLGIALAAFAMSCHAEGVPSNGNTWHKFCNGGTEEGKALCSVFVNGVHNGIGIQAAHTKTKALYCMPGDVSTRQAADVFSKLLENFPQYRHLDATSLVVMSLTAAFPCEKQTRPVVPNT